MSRRRKTDQLPPRGVYITVLCRDGHDLHAVGTFVKLAALEDRTVAAGWMLTTWIIRPDGVMLKVRGGPDGEDLISDDGTVVSPAQPRELSLDLVGVDHPGRREWIRQRLATEQRDDVHARQEITCEVCRTERKVRNNVTARGDRLSSALDRLEPMTVTAHELVVVMGVGVPAAHSADTVSVRFTTLGKLREELNRQAC